MSVPIAVVDAFTGTAFAGNPAAVCLLEAAAEPRWMRAVAAELNLPMTAFVASCGDGFNIRWFMSAGEEDLCGHATLAAAHVLWQTGRLEPGCPARFHTRSGLLTAILDRGWIELDFPVEPVEPVEPMPGLASLGVDPVFVGRSPRDVVVEVGSEPCVRQVQPDLRLLATVQARGVIVTSQAAEGSGEYVLRFFAADIVGGEDPVTGSAQCSLGPYWAERLDTNRLTARQLSPRGGLLRVHHRGNRVGIAGQAVTILEGALRCDGSPGWE
ncbi:MAG: PhzF family phenazine biosynthesis protein [Actinomycetota bacterium]|nr:PhzF family phenazine biosynthesis protein [Actinomycetota bacterium]